MFVSSYVISSNWTSNWTSNTGRAEVVRRSYGARTGVVRGSCGGRAGVVRGRAGASIYAGRPTTRRARKPIFAAAAAGAVRRCRPSRAAVADPSRGPCRGSRKNWFTCTNILLYIINYRT